jgi:cell division FtsZ-interacting protein ZapD
VEINTETLECNPLTPDRDAHLLETASTALDIEDMKKEAEKLKELIKFLKQQRKAFSQITETLTVEADRSEPLLEDMEESAELKERRNPVRLENKALSQDRLEH